MPCWSDMVLMSQSFGQQLFPLHFLLSKAIATKPNCKEVFHTSLTGRSVPKNEPEKMYDYDINGKSINRKSAVIITASKRKAADP